MAMFDPCRQGAHNFCMGIDQHKRCACECHTHDPQLLRAEIATAQARIASLTEAADEVARVLEHEVMPRYLEMMTALSIGDSVVAPMARTALDAYRAALGEADDDGR